MWLILLCMIQLVVIHYFLPNFKILNEVVSEKSLMEKSLQTHRQTYIHTEKIKTIYPSLYFVYWGYNYLFLNRGNWYKYFASCIIIIDIWNYKQSINQTLPSPSSKATSVSTLVMVACLRFNLLLGLLVATFWDRVDVDIFLKQKQQEI